MSGNNTLEGCGPFTFGPCDIGGSRDDERIGAAVFDAEGQPFVLIDPDDVVGGDPVPRAQAIAALMNGPGWVGVLLMQEAAAMLRGYEAHHRAKAADRHDGPVLHDAVAKANRNGLMAARIEAWLDGADTVPTLGDVPDQLRMPTHPVDALKAIAERMGLPVNPVWEAQMRAHCDELVPVSAPPIGPSPFDVGMKLITLARTEAECAAVLGHVRRQLFFDEGDGAQGSATEAVRRSEEAARLQVGDLGQGSRESRFERRPMHEGLDCVKGLGGTYHGQPVDGGQADV